MTPSLVRVDIWPSMNMIQSRNHIRVLNMLSFYKTASYHLMDFLTTTTDRATISIRVLTY